MTASINRLWLALIVPAILIVAIGATVALAQGDDSPTDDSDSSSTLLQEDPTATPEPEETTTPDDGSEDDGSEDDGSEDDATPEKDCPRDGEGGSEGANSTTGLSFRR